MKLVKRSQVLSKLRCYGDTVTAAFGFDIDLMPSQIKNPHLVEVNWPNVTFSDANLSNALLTKINLTGAKLIRSNLKNTCLFQAQVRNTNFEEADLILANLKDVKSISRKHPIISSSVLKRGKHCSLSVPYPTSLSPRKRSVYVKPRIHRGGQSRSC